MQYDASNILFCFVNFVKKKKLQLSARSNVSIVMCVLQIEIDIGSSPRDLYSIMTCRPILHCTGTNQTKVRVTNGNRKG